MANSTGDRTDFSLLLKMGEELRLKLGEELRNTEQEYLIDLLPELTLGELATLRNSEPTSAGTHLALRAHFREEAKHLKLMSDLQKKVLIELLSWLREGRFECRYPSVAFSTWDETTSTREAHTVSFSKAVKRLESRGLIVRYPLERAKQLRLTRLGVRIAKYVAFLKAREAYKLPEYF